MNPRERSIPSFQARAREQEDGGGKKGREEKRNGRRKRGGSADRSLGRLELIRNAPAGLRGFLYEVAGMRRGVRAQGPVKPIKRSLRESISKIRQRKKKSPSAPSVAAGAEEHQGGTVIRSCARLYMVLVGLMPFAYTEVFIC